MTASRTVLLRPVVDWKGSESGPNDCGHRKKPVTAVRQQPLGRIHVSIHTALIPLKPSVHTSSRSSRPYRPAVNVVDTGHWNPAPL